MLVTDFYYNLPRELIAAYPSAERDASSLMVLDRGNGSIEIEQFSSIASFLEPGDLLVLNDTRVIPARLSGRKETGGKVEVFLLRRHNESPPLWSCMLRASKGFSLGQVILLSAGMKAVVADYGDEPESWLLEFSGDEHFNSWLEREGHIPLPPYIPREDEALDRERYQTVFASKPGAVAAPTAGLHFSGSLMGKLDASGVAIEYITLHTGLGTFQPVRVDRVEDHRIHKESYSISESVRLAIERTRAAGKRVVAVGTTTARTLEHASDGQGNVNPGSGEADIFIYPPYSFKVVDALLTNFHLPCSTLIMLVSAFAGRDFTISAYEMAIRNRMRFYSYGDAMLIL